jgi:type I restriction enzyme S subunit
MVQFFLRIGNLSTTSIDLKLANIQYVQPTDGAEGERTQVLPNDILLSITAQMGAVGLVPDGLGQAYINQHTALVRLLKVSAVPRFAAYSLLSDAGKQQSYMATNGGTKQGLGLDDVANLFVALPSINEQQIIADYIDRETSRIDTLISHNKREIQLMQEYRTRLVSDVVTGKLDVRGVELPLVEAVVGEEVEAAIEEEGANPVYDDELIESR